MCSFYGLASSVVRFSFFYKWHQQQQQQIKYKHKQAINHMIDELDGKWKTGQFSRVRVI
jgi:hypothetical protein